MTNNSINSIQESPENTINDSYTINENDEKTKLINSEKLTRTYSNEQQQASTSTPTKNYFGISNTMNCPTCNGTGKVKKDEQDKLVALIPLTDHRLKPKRIWLWILMTFIACLLVAFILTFILAPRNISISNSLVDLHPYNISIISNFENQTVGMNIFFEETFHIQNYNFFQVTMKNLTLELNRISHLVAPQISYPKNFPLKPRERTEVIVKVKYIMYSETDPYVDLCTREVINELFALITTTFSFTTLWTSGLEVQTKNTQYLYCTNSSIVHPHTRVV